MSPPPTPSAAAALTRLLLTTTLFATTALATSSCDLSNGCPACGMDYSPFKPWFAFNSSPGSSRQLCWQTIDCTLGQSGEERKQQYAAVALIMGLIPLTLKDVTWPERRSVPLTARLPPLVEVLVRTLNLEPESAAAGASSPERRRGEVREWWEQRSIARWAWEGGRGARTSLLLGALALALAACYAALALVETFSKRAVLGCPFPVFVLTWHLLAVVPAALHTVATAWRAPTSTSTTTTRRRPRVVAAAEEVPMVPLTASSADAVEGGGSRRREKGVPPHVFGSRLGSRAAAAAAAAAASGDSPSSSPSSPETEVWWVAQLLWAIYYIVGTLVYTSISTVTAIELFVWVIASIMTTAMSRLLAFALCMRYEGKAGNTGRDDAGGSGQYVPLD